MQSDAFFADQQSKRKTTDKTLARLSIRRFDHSHIVDLLSKAVDAHKGDKKKLFDKYGNHSFSRS
jgi:hypothetical protein